MFNKVEKILFYALVGAHLLPLILLDFFVTHDGPAHTYNTVLIESLHSQHPQPASTYFISNPDPQPNWAYNAIMLATDKLFSPNISERIIIGMIILLMAFSFRALIVHLNPDNIFLSYLVLPFLFSFHLYIGFFNFCIGAAVFFFLLWFLLKKGDKPKLFFFITLSLLSFVLLFSHAFSFMLFCLCLAAVLIAKNRSAGNTLFSKQFLKKMIGCCLALLPSGLFCIYFLFTKYDDYGKGIHWLDISQSLKYIYECGPAITLTHDPEQFYGITVSAMMLVNIFLLIGSSSGRSGGRNIFMSVWLFLSLITLLLYFALPDTMGVWGFISLRTLMFFFLLLPLWLAHGKFPAWWKYVQVTILAVMISLRLNYQYGLSKNLDEDAKEMFSLNVKMKPNSVVLPLDYYTNWMHDNISNYLGTQNNIIVLDNYEAVFPHFPLMWRKEFDPYVLLGNFSGRTPPCATMDKFENVAGLRIDYVVRWMYQPVAAGSTPDSCTKQINEYLEKNYRSIARSPKGMAELFERNGR